ncbi:crossover junction endodeoxyribonuclease RuvC [Salana multivorans]|uniref:crossover junction endodeoxyribonuclease RuvC n=1 Tax=Salana multivorans TaxID=120377 RepID=UPI000F4BD286|nr:crossover junction endodeoxyribonuclease RuvC [Salana multivorans]
MLGVDPGLTRCGLGAVTATGRTVRIVDVGVVTTSPDLPLEARLVAVADALDTWLDRLAPDAVAVERVFAQSNVSTVTATAQVAGLAMVAAHRRGIPVALHTPSEVKAAVTGNGRAGKEQVTTMVTRVLGLDAPPRPADAADALALAICHAWRGGPVPVAALAGAPGGAAAPGGVASASSPGATGEPTSAQQRWLRAEASARRAGRRVVAAQRTVGR